MTDRDFTGEWRDSGPESMRIAGVLANQGVPGSGEFYFKLDRRDATCAMVCGTSDGKAWTYRVVDFKSSHSAFRKPPPVIAHDGSGHPPPY